MEVGSTIVEATDQIYKCRFDSCPDYKLKINDMKVVEIKDECIVFQDGAKLFSSHDQDCCENHYLDFTYISIDDFDGLEFDLTTDNFFERIKDYGIRLIPIIGHPVSIPGYGYNNGYYTENLSLILEFPNGTIKNYDITECQEVRD